MQDLTPCPHCQCYVRLSEQACPFCEGSLAGLEQSAPAQLPRGLSRAAAFAVRAALVAGVTSVAACGGEAEENSSTGKNNSTNSGGTSSGGVAASGGTTTSSGGALASGGTTPTSGGAPTLGDDLGEGGYTPMPIYGGVFPDPELRAKV